MTGWLMAVVYCYVGCNSGAQDGQSLHVLQCDTQTGAARIVQTVKGVQGTTYFQLDREKRNLYTCIREKREGKNRSAIVKFALNGGRIGEMTRIAELDCETPCHISLTPDEKRVAFATYVSATCGTVGIDGTGLVTYKFPDDAMGPNKKRQQKAFGHQTFHFKPHAVKGVGDLMGVVDLGCDRIKFFDPLTMKEFKQLEIKAEPGDGPRHAIMKRESDGKVLFVLNELSSSVSTYALSGDDFKRIGCQLMLPAGYNRWAADGETLNTKAAAIKLTADGKILMASNRGYDSIAFYEVLPCGELRLKNIAPLKGKFPRDFELMPGEKFMVVGHKMSDEIQIYRFDRATCTLEPVGEPIKAYRPLCFKF